MPKQRERGDTSGTESPEQYYWRLLEDKKAGKEWARKIPCEMNNAWAIHGNCLRCGNPHMEEQMTGSECKRCGKKRLVDLYGFSPENVDEMYKEREARKEYSKKFYDMARSKKVSNTRRSDIEGKLPF